ncbi:ATP-binding protein [Chloroflexota bacterium]
MEHIRDILKIQTPINISGENTDTWSSAEEKLSPSADCPMCKGAGFIYPLLPSGEPDYSRVVPCRCVRKEQDKEHKSRLQQYSNLGSLKHCTFNGMESQGRSGNTVHQEQFFHAYQAARAFAADPVGWFILGGPSGSGKTHLAAAIANESVERGYPALYITAPDLLDHLRSAFSPGSETPYDDYFDRVRNAPVLVLDDLGAQSGTSWAKEKLDQLLTHRFNSELPTVIAVMVPIEQLDDRLRTRLADSGLSRVYIIADEKSALGYTWGVEFEAQKKMTFASFDWKRVNLLPEQQQSLEAAYQEAFNFARFPEGWLVFLGVNGCGKTHLSAAIVNYQYQAGHPAMFVVVPELLDHLRAAFSPDSKTSYDQLFESVKKAPLLVLDDFGEQSSTPWAQEKLYQLINYRYNARLPMVVTTTCSMEEIEPRIASRFIDKNLSVPFQILAPDYRSDFRPSPRRAARRQKS